MQYNITFTTDEVNFIKGRLLPSAPHSHSSAKDPVFFGGSRIAKEVYFAIEGARAIHDDIGKVDGIKEATHLKELFASINTPTTPDNLERDSLWVGYSLLLGYTYLQAMKSLLEQEVPSRAIVDRMVAEEEKRIERRLTSDEVRAIASSEAVDGKVKEGEVFAEYLKNESEVSPNTAIGLVKLCHALSFEARSHQSRVGTVLEFETNPSKRFEAAKVLLNRINRSLLVQKKDPSDALKHAVKLALLSSGFVGVDRHTLDLPSALLIKEDVIKAASIVALTLVMGSTDTHTDKVLTTVLERIAPLQKATATEMNEAANKKTIHHVTLNLDHRVLTDRILESDDSDPLPLLEGITGKDEEERATIVRLSRTKEELSGDRSRSAVERNQYRRDLEEVREEEIGEEVDPARKRMLRNPVEYDENDKLIRQSGKEKLGLKVLTLTSLNSIFSNVRPKSESQNISIRLYASGVVEEAGEGPQPVGSISYVGDCAPYIYSSRTELGGKHHLLNGKYRYAVSTTTKITADSEDITYPEEARVKGSSILYIGDGSHYIVQDKYGRYTGTPLSATTGKYLNDSSIPYGVDLATAANKLIVALAGVTGATSSLLKEYSETIPSIYISTFRSKFSDEKLKSVKVETSSALLNIQEKLGLLTFDHISEWAGKSSGANGVWKVKGLLRAKSNVVAGTEVPLTPRMISNITDVMFDFARENINKIISGSEPKDMTSLKKPTLLRSKEDPSKVTAYPSEAAVAEYEIAFKLLQESWMAPGKNSLLSFDVSKLRQSFGKEAKWVSDLSKALSTETKKLVNTKSLNDRVTSLCTEISKIPVSTFKKASQNVDNYMRNSGAANEAESQRIPGNLIDATELDKLEQEMRASFSKAYALKGKSTSNLDGLKEMMPGVIHNINLAITDLETLSNLDTSKLMDFLEDPSEEARTQLEKSFKLLKGQLGGVARFLAGETPQAGNSFSINIGLLDKEGSKALLFLINILQPILKTTISAAASDMTLSVSAMSKTMTTKLLGKVKAAPFKVSYSGATELFAKEKKTTSGTGQSSGLRATL